MSLKGQKSAASCHAGVSGPSGASVFPVQDEPGRDWRLLLPTPEPVPSARAYRRERRLALTRSPRTLENYVRYLRSGRMQTTPTYLPIKLDIENVSRCNFHCTMCQVSDWPGQQRASDMRLEDFKSLIDSQYGLVEIKIQGMGEPTLARDTLFEMIRYARRMHIWVRTITNASLLHLNDNYRKMIDSGVNEIQISVDGATKETFEGIRRGSRFERVVENCRLINAYAEAEGLFRTKMWVVVQKANLHEMNDLVRLAKDLGFRSMVFSLELQDWGQEKWHEPNRQIAVGDCMTRPMAERAMELGTELGVKVAFWMAITKYSTSTPEKLCPWPFERAFVSSDMRIVPCCMIADPNVKELGDARALSRAWSDSAYGDFRRAHSEGRIPDVCCDCYR